MTAPEATPRPWWTVRSDPDRSRPEQPYKLSAGLVGCGFFYQRVTAQEVADVLNAHDALVAACGAALSLLDDNAEAGPLPQDQSGLRDQLRAALAAARGTP